MNVLCIGAGPSVDFDYIKNFKGILVCVDRILKTLLENNITPDYCVTYEKGIWSSNTWQIDRGFVIMFENIPKVKTKFIHSPASNDDIVKNLIKDGHDVSMFTGPLFPAVNNVGLFAWYFTVEKLKPEIVDIIGIDHLIQDFPQRPIKCQWFREVFFELESFYSKDITTLINGKPCKLLN